MAVAPRLRHGRPARTAAAAAVAALPRPTHHAFLASLTPSFEVARWIAYAASGVLVVVVGLLYAGFRARRRILKL